jgi:polyphenol oxidase
MFYEKNLEGISCHFFSDLETIPGLLHAFTSRKTDNFKTEQAGHDSSELNSGKLSLLERLGLEPGQLILLRQVHSNRVLEFLAASEVVRIFRRVGPADGLTLRFSGLFAVIRTADCLPVIAIDPVDRQVCALHAGWRGTRDRIVQKGIAAFLRGRAGRKDDLLVAFGPSIRRCCYEVGDEVRRQFEKAGHDRDRVFDGRNLDLVQANRAQLEALGIRGVLDAGLCTACRTDLFYSFRKEGKTGRMWTLAGFRDQEADP